MANNSSESNWQPFGPLLAILIGILALLVILWLMRRWLRPSFWKKIGLPKGPSLRISQSVFLESDAPEPFDTSRLSQLSRESQNADLRDFLSSVTDTIQQSIHPLDRSAPVGFVEEIVDWIDDLRTLAKNQPLDSEHIQEFRRSLEELLTTCGAELIHSDAWDPSIQRAISKEPKPDTTEPKILSFGSSGIRRFGELIRKQEVVLAIPQPK